jgi:hypothetical protein
MGFPIRVALKALVLFVLLNLVFAVFQPSDSLGRISLYNGLFPGRQRLPHSEDIARSYNLSLTNLPANFASHILSRPKAADEYRVLLMGDSATWGWFLENADTYAGNINAGNYRAADGRRVVAYNLGYPQVGFLKDLLLLDYALQFQPDAVIWLITAQPRSRQIEHHALVRENSARTRDLLTRYDLDFTSEDGEFADNSLLHRSIVGQRRELADLLRLQLVGLSWAATGIDQYIPDEFELRSSDFDEDVSWEDWDEPTILTSDDLAFDILVAAVDHIDVPILIVNEPVYISSGTNSDLRYNAYNPRWAYDQYRELLAAQATLYDWRYEDWWDRIDPSEFTNTPLHLTPAGSRQLSGWLGEAIVALSSE